MTPQKIGNEEKLDIRENGNTKNLININHCILLLRSIR